MAAVNTSTTTGMTALNSLNMPSTGTEAVNNQSTAAMAALISGLNSIFGSLGSSQQAALTTLLASFLQSIAGASTTTPPANEFTGPSTTPTNPTTTTGTNHGKVMLTGGYDLKSSPIAVTPNDSARFVFDIKKNHYGDSAPKFLEFRAHNTGNDTNGSPTYTMISPSGKEYTGQGGLAVPYEEGRWRVKADFSTTTTAETWTAYVQPTGFPMKVKV